MTLRPPQSPNLPRSLDAEERALAKSLPRLHGRTAPGPDLDASILAAAQAAVRTAKPSQLPTRPRIRWIAPASLAASMVLAVGMAWQLRPLPSLETARPTAQSDSAAMAEVRMIEPAPYDAPSPMMKSIPAPSQSTAPVRQLANPQGSITQQGPPSSEAESVQTPAPLPAPPVLPVSTPQPAPPVRAPAPPLPPTADMAAETPPRVGTSARSSAISSGNTLETQTVDRAMRARPAAPAAAINTNSSGAIAQDAAPASADKAGIFERNPQAAPKAVAPSQVMPEVRKEARMAADAGFVDDPDEDVPPATVDSPAVRDAWVHRIVELLEQGKRQEAKASLAEFRRRYPAAVLPSRLHAFDIQP